MAFKILIWFLELMILYEIIKAKHLPTCHQHRPLDSFSNWKFGTQIKKGSKDQVVEAELW